jgi:hypothetical protein
MPISLDPPLAAGPVMLGVAQKMIVEPLEDRQHVVPAPTGEAKLPPVVVIRRLAAHRDHGIDRRTAADHLAARIVERPPIEARLLLGLEHPVRTGIADGKEIADRNMEPDPVVAPAGFQHQHARLGICGQPVGHHATGGPCAYDDVIEVSLETIYGHSAKSLMAPS